jgi:hypothetical protein
MARPRKTQETAPQIVDDVDDVVLTIQDDEEVFFDPEEESFTDADIQAVADEIIKEANKAPSTIANAVPDLSAQVEEMFKTLRVLQDKVDRLLLRDDPSKVLYVLAADVTEGFSNITALIEKIPAKTAPVSAAPKEEAASPRDLVKESIRACLKQLAAGKSYSVPPVVEALKKKVDATAEEVLQVLKGQTDLIKIADGRLHRI